MEALCIELSSKHARVIRENFAQMSLPPAAFQVRVQDVFTSLPQLAAANRQFDLILADPPYGEKNLGQRSASFAQRLLDNPNLKDVLTGSGLFVLGHARRDTLTMPQAWKQTKLLKHGDSMVRFLEKEIPRP
jgi:16S rRNA G966 N2-methylase RsmD